MNDETKRRGPDVPAQITVALIEFVQTALAVAARSYWRVLPNPLPLRRDDVVTTLANLPKPIRVAPLAQPGAVGTWPYTPTSDLERTLFEQRARNVQSRVDEILGPFAQDDRQVPVLLEHGTTETIVQSGDVQQWSRDYVLDGVGWILVDSGGDPRAPVRFILSRPDGTWFPGLPRHPFSDEALAILDAAEAEAGRHNHDTAGTEHILLALTRSAEPRIATAFTDLGLTFEAVDNAVSRATRRGPDALVPRRGARTSRLRHALEFAGRIAQEDQSEAVDSIHLLKSLLLDARASTTMLAQVLKACGLTPDAVAERLS